MPEQRAQVTKGTNKGRPGPSPSLKSLPSLSPTDGFIPQRLRRLNRTPGANYETFRKGIEHPDPAICANVIVGLVKVTNYLLDQQLRRLEQDFLNEGGLRERMSRARLAVRSRERPK